MSLLNVRYRPFPSVFVLALCTLLQTLSVYHIHCVWPNRWLSTKHWFWSQARQLLQLHGSGAHADQHPWHPPQYPVPRRRHRDSHQSRRPTEFRSIHSAAANKPQAAEFRHCSVILVSGNGVQVMCQVVLASELDRESVATTLFISQSNGKRDRETNVVHSLWDRENLQKILERKVHLAVRGERRLAEIVSSWGWGWGEKLVKHLILHFRRSIKNLNVSDFSYIKQVDGQIRLRGTKLACMENWNWRIDSFEKIEQKIAETLKN